MAFVPVLNCVNVQLDMVYAGQNIQNNFNFAFDAEPTVANMNALLTDMEGWRLGQLRPLQTSQLTYAKWTAYDLTIQNGAGVEMPITANTTGGDSVGAATPGNVAIAVKFNTGIRGRSYHGRIYLPGITVSNAGMGHILESYRAAIVEAFTVLPHLGNPGSPRLVVVSRYHGVDANHKPIPRLNGVVTDVTSVSVDPNIDSQRRRLPGRGQ